MKKILILLLILFCFCSRQKNTKIGVIDVHTAPKEAITNLSEIATDINYIPLETTDSSLISRIVSIKARGNYFYIEVPGSILCFDKAGKFISKLNKQGRGPGEYNFIEDFDVSPENNILAISCRSKILLYRQAENSYRFLNELTLSASPNKISFVGTNNDILVQYANVEGINPISMELVNIKGEGLVSWPNYMKFKLKDGMIVMSAYENISFIKTGILYRKELQNDTLFRLSRENRLEPFLIFNTGNKRLTSEARSDGKYYSTHSIEYFHIQKIFCSDLFLFYSFSYNEHRRSYKIIYNLESKKSYEVPAKEFLKDDLAGGIGFDPQYCNEGAFYEWIEPVKLKDYVSGETFKNSRLKYPQKKIAIKKLADSISEFDNPVLIIANIR